MLSDRELNAPTPKLYYEELGRAHDYIMRCKDCQKLVTFQVITNIGCCDGCGNKRFSEVTLLQEQEMADIQSGKIDFPDRELFLAEFSAVDPTRPRKPKAADLLETLPE